MRSRGAALNERGRPRGLDSCSSAWVSKTGMAGSWGAAGGSSIIAARFGLESFFPGVDLLILASDFPFILTASFAFCFAFSLL